MRNIWCIGLITVGSLAVIGCSDNNRNRSSSTARVTVQVNQEDIKQGVVLSVTVGESGLPSRDENRNLIIKDRAFTNQEGEVQLDIPAGEVHQFTLLAQKENNDLPDDSEVSQGVCQWFDGCQIRDKSIAFANAYNLGQRLEWRTVAYDLGNNESVRLTPLTELAAALAMAKVYVEKYQQPADKAGEDNKVSSRWDETGFYSPHSVVQSVSQVSRLFGIDDIQTRTPADLTELNEWGEEEATAAEWSIRYGAILAALQHQGQAYTTRNPEGNSLLSVIATELVENNGQLMQSGTSQAISLQRILADAASNLKKIPVTNIKAKSYVDSVIRELEADTARFASNKDKLTQVTPADVNTLLKNNQSDISLGLARVKAFLKVLRNYKDNFFEAGYRQRITQYLNTLKTLGDRHADSLNAIAQAMSETKDLYIECLKNGNSCPQTKNYPWLNRIDGMSSGRLKLNNGAIQIEQKIARINSTGDDNPTQSQAIDILIQGTYQIKGLTFILKHKFEGTGEDKTISSPSGVRVFYSKPVKQISMTEEEIGQEIRWSDFELVVEKGTINATQIQGVFSLLFIGVEHPDNSNADRHFNIDKVTLKARISDRISTNNDDDRRIMTVNVSAQASNSGKYHPEKKYASFNGFLRQQKQPVYAKNSVEDNLVSYSIGNETIRGQNVEYFDFSVPLATSYRYRFYPTVKRVDKKDLDKDGDKNDSIFTHDFERCELQPKSDPATVKSCDPKQRLLSKRNRQHAVSDLWRSGVLSHVQVPSRGRYFVKWPVQQDDNQCLVLQTLENSRSEAGTLHEPAVLGLDSLAFTTEIKLDDDNSQTRDPDTLLDVRVVARTQKRYRINAALSHDYSRVSSSGLLVGSGDNLDSITLSYNTRSDIVTTGSAAIYKDGVSLTVNGSSTSVDSKLDAFILQKTGVDPLPYKYIPDGRGGYERCVLNNKPRFISNGSIEDALIPINFRGVVYGRIRKEKGVWVARFVDGEFQTLN